MGKRHLGLGCWLGIKENKLETHAKIIMTPITESM